MELNYLNSLTEYQVAVFAIYRSSASEALRGSATTRKFLYSQGCSEDDGGLLEVMQVLLAISGGRKKQMLILHCENTVHQAKVLRSRLSCLILH